MQDREKSTALMGAAAGLLTAIAHIAGGYFLSARAAGMITASDALHTEGCKTRNARGEEVVLRGTSAGSIEVDRESFSAPEQNFIRLCEDNWMTEKDLDAMKELGVNCVRLPFRYDVQAGGKGSRNRNGSGDIDFDRLDRMVEQCARRGMYVIVALEFAPGFQSSGAAGGKNGLLDCTLDGLRHRNRVIEFWRQAACRFAGNPAVAAYDLLGGPALAWAGKGGGDRLLWCFYDRIYRAVRGVDASPIIMLETPWDTVSLPDPEKYRWENVMYRLHGRDLADADIDACIASLGSKAALRVPVLADIGARSGIREDLLDACNESGLGWLACAWKGVSQANGGCYAYPLDIGNFPLPGDASVAGEAKREAARAAEDAFKADETVIAALRRCLRPEADLFSVQTAPGSAPEPASPAQTGASPDTAAQGRKALAPVLALGVFTVAGSATAGIILKHRQKVLKPKTRK